MRMLDICHICQIFERTVCVLYMIGTYTNASQRIRIVYTTFEKSTLLFHFELSFHFIVWNICSYLHFNFSSIFSLFSKFSLFLPLNVGLSKILS